MKRMKVGVIGCGNISPIYLKNMPKFVTLDVVACADMIPEKARTRAEEFNIPRSCSVEEILADKDIEIIVNLTIPKAHAEVGLEAISAGKHVYAEKPLAIKKEDGQRLLKEAEKRSLRVGSAPDTFLGGGIQTCRKLIDDGWIGNPVAGTAFMTCRGHESWHPDPDFYYQPGAGPMFDMGPYYLTALVNLLGPVKKVAAITKKTFGERLITSQPKCGTRIKVNVNTHVAGIMEFADGSLVTIITSFDIWAASLPRIEIYGTEGSIGVPDPNSFGGPVKIFKPALKEWKEVPLSHGYAENSRGLGIADMANAIMRKTEHRANGELAYHILEVMHSFDESSKSGKHIELKSTCRKPEPLPLEFPCGKIS